MEDIDRDYIDWDLQLIRRDVQNIFWDAGRRQHEVFIEEVLVPFTNPVSVIINGFNWVYWRLREFGPISRRIYRFLTRFQRRLNEDITFRCLFWTGYICFCQVVGPFIEPLFLNIWTSLGNL